MISVAEALHFEKMLEFREINAVLRTGGAAIEDCLVYSSKNYYHGDISVSTMYHGKKGYFFISQGEKIIGIIDLASIRGELRLKTFDEKSDVAEICYGPLETRYSLYVRRNTPTIRPFVKNREPEGADFRQTAAALITEQQNENIRHFA